MVRAGYGTAAACVIAILLAGPAWGQFGPQQTAFLQHVKSLKGKIDIGVFANGTVSGPDGSTIDYFITEWAEGTLILDTWDPASGSLSGKLSGNIGVSDDTDETGTRCHAYNVHSDSPNWRTATDALGLPLRFSLTFDTGSDTWSLVPSNNQVMGHLTSFQVCDGQTQNLTIAEPVSFMPINTSMGFPFPSTGFDLTGTGSVLCTDCGNGAEPPLTYTFKYNLEAELNPCAAALGSDSDGFGPAAGGGSVDVSVEPGCAWSVSPPADSWVTITPPLTGSGPGTVNFSLAANDSGAARGASVTISQQPYRITQWAAGTVFVPVPPCRVADTRGADGPFGGPEMSARSLRSFQIPQSACGIPTSAVGYSMNVTVVPGGGLGYLALAPTGQPLPLVSTLNSFTGKIVANAAIVPAGTGGSIDVFVTDPTQVILDINGYFAPPSATGGLEFYPVTPCRVADTRLASGAFGGPSITAGGTRDFAIPSSQCGIPASARAYSLNATVVPHGGLAYLSLWPQGQSQPGVSTLNSFDGSIVANAAIVPAGTNGGVSAFAAGATDLILDINGYFAPPDTGGMLFYPVTPCRISDTRNTVGPFGGPIMGDGETRAVGVPLSDCNIPLEAQAFSLNATVVPPGPLAYLSLWPTAQTQPGVSTLNSFQGLIVANAALVPAGLAGGVNAFVTNRTHLILDINGYFGP